MAKDPAGGSRFEGSRLVISLIEAAVDPADLFAIDAARTFRRMVRLLHPDLNPDDARAAGAFMKLMELWEKWLIRQKQPSPLGPTIARGDIADLHEDARGLLKIARSPDDNDLLVREAAALTRLGRAGDPRFLAYTPKLIERQLQIDLDTGIQRKANLIGRLDGFVTLAQVQDAYPAGLDPRDAAWMWCRLLVAIGFAHRAGVVHAAVVPEHVLIHPNDHSLVLVDWCYAFSEPGQLTVAVPASYVGWYPADVLGGRVPDADLDIWLATQCMINLIGSQVPAPLASFSRYCTLPHPGGRPSDAWHLLQELHAVLEYLYGPRKFRAFEMPA